MLRRIRGYLISPFVALSLAACGNPSATGEVVGVQRQSLGCLSVSPPFTIPVNVQVVAASPNDFAVAGNNDVVRLDGKGKALAGVSHFATSVYVRIGWVGTDYEVVLNQLSPSPESDVYAFKLAGLAPGAWASPTKVLSSSFLPHGFTAAWNGAGNRAALFTPFDDSVRTAGVFLDSTSPPRQWSSPYDSPRRITDPTASWEATQPVFAWVEEGLSSLGAPYSYMGSWPAAIVCATISSGGVLIEGPTACSTAAPITPRMVPNGLEDARVASAPAVAAIDGTAVLVWQESEFINSGGYGQGTLTLKTRLSGRATPLTTSPFGTPRVIRVGSAALVVWGQSDGFYGARFSTSGEMLDTPTYLGMGQPEIAYASALSRVLVASGNTARFIDFGPSAADAAQTCGRPEDAGADARDASAEAGIPDASQDSGTTATDGGVTDAGADKDSGVADSSNQDATADAATARDAAAVVDAANDGLDAGTTPAVDGAKPDSGNGGTGGTTSSGGTSGSVADASNDAAGTAGRPSADAAPPTQPNDDGSGCDCNLARSNQGGSPVLLLGAALLFTRLRRTRRRQS